MGNWHVAENLPGDEAAANGLVVVADLPVRNTVVADCRNDYLPEIQQRANAQIMAASKRAIELLVDVETYLGDLPSRDRAAGRLHQRIVSLLLEVL